MRTNGNMVGSEQGGNSSSCLRSGLNPHKTGRSSTGIFLPSKSPKERGALHAPALMAIMSQSTEAALCTS